MTTTTTTIGKGAALGAAAGLAASVVMAMYAMIVAWIKGDGFFTPMYHIASLWISPSNLMTSMQDAMMQHDFHFAFGPAILGAMIHMMTGAMYGALFGLIVAAARVKGSALAIAGVGYGLLVFLISSFVALPLAAAIFSSGDQITHMARMAGWWTFVSEHLLFGLALGLIVLRGRGRTLTDA